MGQRKERTVIEGSFGVGRIEFSGRFVKLVLERASVAGDQEVWSLQPSDYNPEWPTNVTPRDIAFAIGLLVSEANGVVKSVNFFPIANYRGGTAGGVIILTF